mmetsp:Transcript_62610/g.123024  ORF Transcript_62610/g.123024 Transcript_62610/m.123024 type:complete len:239 (+) Transcript_62610:774-1490(+)
MNTMPLFSTDFMASLSTSPSWSSTNFASSCSSTNGRASLMAMRFFPTGLLPAMLLFDIMVNTSCAGLFPEESAGGITGISTSTSLSSRSPLRSAASQTFSSSPPPPTSSTFSSTLPSATKRLKSVSSAAFLASSRWVSACCFFTIPIEISTRSLMIWSTSLPWKPTSVNLVASTLMKGASERSESRRAISVLPQPVGPIIRIFFGMISSVNAAGSLWRRQRFRRAIATALFASPCPMM